MSEPTSSSIKTSSTLTSRQRILNTLFYKPVDRLPVVHFGFWGETLQKWVAEGHLPQQEANEWGDGTPTDEAISARLGFDGNYYSCFCPNTSLYPAFDSRVVRTLPDGSQHVMTGDGVVILQSPGAGSIPAEIEHTLTDRKSWEEHYLPRLQWSPERVTTSFVHCGDTRRRWDDGGLEYLQTAERDYLYGLRCGSLYGRVRDILGVVGLSYLAADDPELLEEIIETTAEICFRCTEYILRSGAHFDFGHFWEDICFRGGPLVSPEFFRHHVGPHYRRITSLLNEYGIEIVSLDCDGRIDALIPTWLENGVNTMFPIEVGTWNAEFAPWREQYGTALRGVGGVRKAVFSRDRAAVDAEIERIRPMIDQGGYIPCPDHRLPPDSKWDLVCYYGDRLRAL